MNPAGIENSTTTRCPDVWISDRRVKDIDMKTFLRTVRTAIFDVDRTLADITTSYENSIRGATAYTLQSMGVANIDEQRLATENDLYPLWQKPELADVWYLTYAVSAYYQTQFIAQKSIDYDFSEFVPILLQAEGKDKTEVIRNAVRSFCQQKKWDVDKILPAFNSMWDQDLLKSIFQQMFMDTDGYRAEYGEPFIPCRADWNNDDTIIPPEELRALLLQFKNKGIATARPASEVQKFLKQFGLTNLFNPDTIATNEDGSKTERIKKSLAALSDGEDLKKIPAVYIGDTVGDINAVRELQKEGYNIGVVSVGSKAPDNLMQTNYETLISQTDAYINSLSNLPKILAGEEVKT